MDVEELKDLIRDVPDTAKVYVEADHGQMPEHASWLEVTTDKHLPLYGEDIKWTDGTGVNAEDVTAIRIGA